MSCFIVAPENIQAQTQFIAAILNAPSGYSHRYHIGAFEDLQNVFRHCKGAKGYDPHMIYRTLYITNLRAYNGRYKDHTPVKEFARYEPSAPPTDLLQLYKYMQCYLCQCAEEPVFNTAFYVTIEDLKNRLASSIIRSLPEYEEKNWD